MKTLPLLALLLPVSLAAQVPVITPVSTGSEAEFRGLHVVNNRILWASGSGGRYAMSADGGRSWRADSVPGAANMFFIDVHAFDAQSAVLAGTSFDGGEARIYRTSDGGASWQQVFALQHPSVFLDGVAFWDRERGIAFGDPVDSTFFLLRTENGGRSWRQVPRSSIPAPLPGEAAFAASGTSLAVGKDGRGWFGTGGGAHARVYRTSDYGHSWEVSETPLAASASAGIFGLAFRDARHGIAVAGDHQQATLDAANVLRTDDGGIRWTLAGATTPPGVKYGIAMRDKTLVAPAPRGTAWSADGGRTWQQLTSESYNTAAFAPDGTLWLAGVKGAVARVEFRKAPQGVVRGR